MRGVTFERGEAILNSNTPPAPQGSSAVETAGAYQRGTWHQPQAIPRLSLHLPRRQAANVEMNRSTSGVVPSCLNISSYSTARVRCALGIAQDTPILMPPHAIGVAPRHQARLKDLPRQRPDALFVGHRTQATVNRVTTHRPDGSWWPPAVIVVPIATVARGISGGTQSRCPPMWSKRVRGSQAETIPAIRNRRGVGSRCHTTCTYGITESRRSPMTERRGRYDFRSRGSVRQRLTNVSSAASAARIAIASARPDRRGFRTIVKRAQPANVITTTCRMR